jgi:chaperonin GroES
VLDAEPDSGAERVADDVQRETGQPGGEGVERPNGVGPLVGEVATLGTGTRAEVEAQRRDADGGQGAEQARDDRVESIAAEAGVRVQQHGAAPDVRRVGDVGDQFDAVSGGQGDGSGGRIHEGGRYSHDVVSAPDDKLPIKMLNDRLLVRIPEKDGERRTQGGILIPATAQMAKRLVWAEVVALGQNVRAAEVGDLVLFSPEDRYEVEVQGSDYIMLRERDLHAVAAERIEASTGLYL